MSRDLKNILLLACAFLVAGLGGASRAETPSGDVPRAFIDLTAGVNAQAPPATASSVATSGTIFVDLSTGAASTAIQHRDSPRSETGRPRRIDLTNGAAVPEIEELRDETVPEIEGITVTADQLDDPYEGANRGRFSAHVRLHRYLIDPVERAYIYVVPERARAGVHNLLVNLETPSVLANDLFQGKLDRAGDTLSRFVVNTTLGLGGLIDIAGRAGIAYRDDDFGATLATYGVGEYPYLLVPVIGPSNPRDLGGKVVDFFLDPLRWVTLPGGIVTSIGNSGIHELDKRSEDVGALDRLAKTAPDAYAIERSRARESRAAALDATPDPQQ